MFYGAIMSMLMVFAFLGIAYLNPEIRLLDYPPDIREKFGPMSEKARKQRRLVGVSVFLILFGTLTLSAIQFTQIGGGGIFFAIFLGTFVVLLIFNVVDLVILDWLVFLKIKPKFVVLPGAEGAEGYRDCGFHFRAFLKGVAESLVVSLIIAGVASVIYAAVLPI